MYLTTQQMLVVKSGTYRWGNMYQCMPCKYSHSTATVQSNNIFGLHLHSEELYLCEALCRGKYDWRTHITLYNMYMKSYKQTVYVLGILCCWWLLGWKGPDTSRSQTTKVQPKKGKNYKSMMGLIPVLEEKPQLDLLGVQYTLQKNNLFYTHTEEWQFLLVYRTW